MAKHTDIYPTGGDTILHNIAPGGTGKYYPNYQTTGPFFFTNSIPRSGIYTLYIGGNTRFWGNSNSYWNDNYIDSQLSLFKNGAKILTIYSGRINYRTLANITSSSSLTLAQGDEIKFQLSRSSRRTEDNRQYQNFHGLILLKLT